MSNYQGFANNIPDVPAAEILCEKSSTVTELCAGCQQRLHNGAEEKESALGICDPFFSVLLFHKNTKGEDNPWYEKYKG